MPSPSDSIAVEVIRKHAANLAVRIVLRGDAVFVAKLGTTGPATIHGWPAKRRSPSASVSRRCSYGAGTRPRARRSAIGPTSITIVFRAHGGSVPILVAGEVVGTITMSGEPDVVDHAIVAEAIRRYRSTRDAIADPMCPHSLRSLIRRC